MNTSQYFYIKLFNLRCLEHDFKRKVSFTIMTNTMTETTRKKNLSLNSGGKQAKTYLKSLIDINKSSSGPSQLFLIIHKEADLAGEGQAQKMWDTHHAMTQSHWQTGVDVWDPRGSPCSPAFVVTVKSGHSAFDWELPAQQCLYYAGDSYICMFQCTPGEERRQQHTHSVDTSSLPTCSGSNRRGC